MEDRTPISGMKARYTSHYTIGPHRNSIVSLRIGRQGVEPCS